MDFVLVFPLIFAFLSTGQSSPEDTEQMCYNMCPPGYHKVGNCGNAKYRCAKCGYGTFTEIENSYGKCLRCGLCINYEVEIKPCHVNSNVKCDCKIGYYRKNSKSKQCQKCERTTCSEIPECKRTCFTTTLPPSPNISTAATTSASTSTRNTALNEESIPVVNPVPLNLNELPWLFLMVFLVILLVLLLLLLFFARKTLKYPDSCLCWSVNKDLELPVEHRNFNEQSGHQSSSPNTLTFNISEETPMMTLSQSPATPEHPAHISPLDTKHKAARQDEQLEQWPAILLYAIIKEVPLRRWKEFLRLLSVADQQLERVELEASLGLGSMERQYQMLRLWSQRPSASLNDVFSALHYMDLSGCAQLLQESLEKLQ